LKEILTPDMRHIMQKYEKLGARIGKMAEEIGISDTIPILIKYDKIRASFSKMAYTNIKN
jgi:hypothetical protein